MVGVTAELNWWREINESREWQDAIFYFLCGAYSVVSVVALVQLIRIQLRVPEYGWTTQKVFHLMNVIVNGLRAVIFGIHMQVFLLRPMVLTLVMLDLPGILFFSTYTLLVLFWAEIYHQAKEMSARTNKLRICYVLVNGGIYLIQIYFWICIWLNDNSTARTVSKIFLSAVSFLASIGFAIYGGRLFFLLKQFPIVSKGRRKKLYEVGSVTAICFTCFFVRCVVEGLSTVKSEASLYVLDHPILNLAYYTLTEILPSGLVLLILRKVPPKRPSGQYHPIR